MSDTINFSKFEKSFKTLNTSKICKTKLKNQLFEFIPKLFNYEEEGEKLNFDLLIIKDFEKEKRKVSGYLFKKIIEVKSRDLNLRKHIKSIAPFSKNSWNLYIGVEGTKYSFGIYKDFSGINAVGLEVILKNNYLQIFKVDKDILEFKNQDNTFLLETSINKKKDLGNRKSNINSLVNCLTKGHDLDNSNLEPFKKNLSNFLFNTFDKIHGTIIIVVDSDEDIDDFFINSIIKFDEPISLFDEFTMYVENCSKEDKIIQEYYSKVGMLSICTNIDGITILNTRAELLAYNVFIKNETAESNNDISGGARKKAAVTIEGKEIETLKGLYFQSHDGDCYFKEFN